MYDEAEFTADGLSALLRECLGPPDPVLNWVKKGDGTMTVGEVPYDPSQFMPPAGIKHMESNKSRYEVDEDGLLRDLKTGKLPEFINGLPFPEIDLDFAALRASLAPCFFRCTSSSDTAAGVTPAMREGSGLVRFSEAFPDRYHDVGIAEQHAVTLAAGMACEGLKPVVAIYSTFMQRAYDQMIHDVDLQNLDVTYAVDRAGEVGADGATHAGVFDLTFCRTLPNMVIMAPSDEAECRQMLQTAYAHAGPALVRYPRGAGKAHELSV